MEIIDITIIFLIQPYRFGKYSTENKALQYQFEVCKLLVHKVMRDLLEKKSKIRINAV